MKEYRFSGDEPILVFKFLSGMVEESDILGLKKAQADIDITLPQFLT